MEAHHHSRQGDRLRALSTYGILDTEREAAFDEIVGLAAKLCNVPIAAINLIDGDRQWFKAEVGLGVRETPLSTSICAHVILENDLVEIRDTLLDRRMADNPLCLGEPGLRFYAGALLKTEDDLPIGTLCILDYHPRALTPLQREVIQVLAHQTMAQLDLRRMERRADLLMREVDHRVKNSIFSLSAITLLEREAAVSEEARAALAKVCSRIGTVAALHEALQHAQSGERVDLGAFVARIGKLLSEIAPNGVRLEVDVEPVEVSPRQSSAVGLLVNELVTNAFTHGFRDKLDTNGRVHLSVRRGADGKVVISCADNGVGFAPGAEHEAGLGMRMVDLVCAQLETQLEIESGAAAGHGLRATFAFDPETRTFAR
jgi:two-component sensor histidine kinase